MSTGGSGVSIGEAAALYGLTTSTLRWWEAQGVIPPASRHRGRRVYSDADLRRIGLAYLCCVTGMMPLQHAAIVTSRESDLHTWRRTVEAQLESLQRRIEQMQAAHDYLSHVLCCEHDDMTQCPYLDGELDRHTPRGRITSPDLIAAARAACRDEISASAHLRDENAHTCPVCGQPRGQHIRGRPRRYCSPACRQRAYRSRRAVAA
jgi:MerR family copper efflux transcriptional regulator